MFGIFRRSRNRSERGGMDITKPVRKAARKSASLARRGARAATSAVSGRGRKKTSRRSGIGKHSVKKTAARRRTR